MGDAESEGGATATEGGLASPRGWAEVSGAVWPAPNRDGGTVDAKLALADGNDTPRTMTDGDDDAPLTLSFGDDEEDEEEEEDPDMQEGEAWRTRVAADALEAGRPAPGCPAVQTDIGGNGDVEELQDNDQIRAMLFMKICVGCLYSALKPTPICGGFCKVRLYWR